MNTTSLFRNLWLLSLGGLLLACSRTTTDQTEAHSLTSPTTTSVDRPEPAPTPAEAPDESDEVSSVRIFGISFVVAVTQYKAALWLKDGKGLMRVRYYKDGVGPVLIQQQMQVEDTRYGMRLTGYNPVDPSSGDAVSYSPDNFYLSRDENGEWLVTNIDDNGVMADASIRVIEGRYAQNEFLSDFNWEID